MLIHETQVPSPGNSKEAILANVSLSVHTSPEQAGKIFNETRPRMAIYSHIIPPDRTEEEIVAATRPIYKGPLRVAHDFMKITIGKEIEFSEVSIIEDEAFEKSAVFDKK
jgi:ribonuclease Z